MYCTLWRGDFSFEKILFLKVIAWGRHAHLNEQEIHICIDDHTLNVLMLLVTFLVYIIKLFFIDTNMD